MKNIFLALLLTLLNFTCAYAWKGKVIAVNSPDSFVVLKDGSPMTVTLDGVSDQKKSAKILLDASSLSLMKDVDVEETGRTISGGILADIKIDGRSLSDAINADMSGEIPASSLTNGNNSNKISTNSTNINQRFIIADKIDASNIERELSSPHIETTSSEITTEVSSNKKLPSRPKVEQNISQKMPSQDTSLGLWPEKIHVQKVNYVTVKADQPDSYKIHQTDEESVLLSDNSMPPKREHDKSVRSSTLLKANKGFLKPKAHTETYIGVSLGPQLNTHEHSRVPYEDLGMSEGFSFKHFTPSGFGFGTDFTIAESSGKEGLIGNATNGTSYDYKKKTFMNYTLTGSLLYRFYSDPNFIPYVGLHGGYTLFSGPDTIFNLSDGAPVVGGGAGFLYKFDSGFTVGFDSRYLKTIGIKKDDPSGQLNTMFTAGYTFD